MAVEQEIQKASEAKQTFGYTGTEIYNGFFSEETNAVWRDEQRITTVNKMRNTDATVQAVLHAVKTPILSAEREIIPFSQDKRDIEIADEVRKQLNTMSLRTFDELLKEICTMFDFGHSVFEKIWGMNKDGMIFLKDLAPRVQSSIQQWSLSNGEPGIRQTVRSDMGYEPKDSKAADDNTFEIPWDKLVVFTNDKEGDDYTGRSILRSAYKHFVMKDGTYKVAAIGIEKTAIGVPTGTLPEGVTASHDEYNKFEEALENIRINEKQHLLLPHGYQFEFVTSNGGQLGTVVKDFIDHHDRHILLAVLAEFLDLGSGAGSFALSKDQSSFFLMHIEHYAKYIASQINRQVIRNIVDYNFKDVEGYPHLKFTSFGQIDFKEMAEVYNILIATGIVNVLNDVERNFARKIFKLPEIEMDEKEAPKKPVPKPQPKTVKEKDDGDDEDEDKGLAQLAQKKK
ncbi:MAG: DUF935 family protein, partial [Nitrosomonadaceae bacterium]